MPDHESDNRPERFSEAQAKSILARAAELDTSIASHFTTADLKRIAQEATINASAIDLALTEAVSVVTPSTSTRRSQLRASLLKAAGLVGVGAGLGALAVTTDALSLGPESAAAVFGPSAAFVLYRALWHRWHGSLRGFLHEAVLALGSFTLTVTVLEGFHATNPALLWSLICGAVGSTVAGLELRSKSPASLPVITSQD